MGYQDYSAAGGVFFQGLEDGGFVELTFVYVFQGGEPSPHICRQTGNERASHEWSVPATP